MIPTFNGASELYPYQRIAVDKLRTGSILYGGVGSGKSRTAIAYYYENHRTLPLYVITTAKKRDTNDWNEEFQRFKFLYGESLVVDSWNNIKKYIGIKHAFFIFDEQRVIGSGSWVKSFLKIAKENEWILLTATPGDTWLDYIPVFMANGFYKTRTEFIRKHVVYNAYTKFPKIDRFVDEGVLLKHRNSILVHMRGKPKIETVYKNVYAEYDSDQLNIVMKKRWDPYANKPIKDVSAYFFLMRKVVNSHPSRLSEIRKILVRHKRLIVFYNFNYELEILRELKFNYPTAEYNGHKHEEIPDEKKWVYLVQYISGAEGWNCIQTNAVAFYSLNYSYRLMSQAAGRIDRVNTPFNTLYYYKVLSNTFIDSEIRKALSNKRDFNEGSFSDSWKKHTLL